jgi:hypothetical protein
MDAVDEHEGTQAIRRAHRQDLGGGGADVVGDERNAGQVEDVQEAQDGIGLRGEVDGSAARRFAVPEEVGSEDPETRRQPGHDALPEEP